GVERRGFWLTRAQPQEFAVAAGAGPDGTVCRFRHAPDLRGCRCKAAGKRRPGRQHALKADEDAVRGPLEKVGRACHGPEHRAGGRRAEHGECREGRGDRQTTQMRHVGRYLEVSVSVSSREPRTARFIRCSHAPTTVFDTGEVATVLSSSRIVRTDAGSEGSASPPTTVPGLALTSRT